MTRTWICITVWFLLAVSGAARGATTTQSASEPPKPTLVTLKLDDTPAVEALRQLLAQVDIPADWLQNQGFPQRMAGVTANGSFEKQPFNQVLLELCRQCWLEPQATPMQGQPMQFQTRARQPMRPPATGSATGPATTRSSRGVTVYRSRQRGGAVSAPRTTTQPSWVDGPAVFSGPFAFIPSETRRTSRVDLDDGNKAPGQTMELSIMVLRDPKVPVFSMSGLLEVDEAIDEADRSLRAPPRVGPGRVRPRVLADGRWSPWTITVPLAYTEESRRLKLLRGRFVTTIITRTEPVEIVNADGAVAGEKTVGDVRFTVGKLEPMGPASRLDITLFRASDGDMQRWDEVRGIVRSDLFRINDASDGGGFRVVPQVHSFLNNSEYRGMIQFQPARQRGDAKPKLPTKVVWNVPVEFHEFAIPVEFKDLPLPNQR